LQLLQQRFRWYFSALLYLPGIVNDMANILSHASHLSDNAILQLFNTQFTQTCCWTLWQLPPHMTSAVMSALQRKWSKPESFLCAPELQKNTGIAEPNSALNLASINPTT
jgi:hypothetical protein